MREKPGWLIGQAPSIVGIGPVPTRVHGDDKGATQPGAARLGALGQTTVAAGGDGCGVSVRAGRGAWW